MGTCLSKKSTTTTPLPDPQLKIKPNNPPESEIKKQNNNHPAAIVVQSTAKDQEVLKKEIFVIKHRKSHEIDRNPDQENPKLDKKKNPNLSGSTSDISQSSTVTAAAVVSEPEKVGSGVRTSSCTKEEVDAILIQCGRLSRSSSTGKVAGSENRGRRYSGSKRSFDFDLEMGSKNDDGDEGAVVDGGAGDEERRRQHHRNRQREPRVSSPSSSSRRRSRERDQQQQRSGSKETGSSGGGRRVSRSPNRRSESPVPNSNCGVTAAGGNRPGKLVSVPATDKSNNAGGGEAAGGVKRIQVKRNVGEASAVGSRSAASPRSRSPARANLRVLNENPNQEQRQVQPLSLSRSNSRKAEHSPFRRNPLAEIDNNATGSEQPGNKAQAQKPNGEKNKVANNAVPAKNGLGKEHQIGDEIKVTVVSSGIENPKLHQTVARTRSSRLSRELDINPETLLNPNQPSYASLLLEDIQNFHQKNTTTTTTTSAAAATAAPPAFSLPACVSKACSILEAVADLNSTTSSNNLSSVFSEDRRKSPTDHQVKKEYPVMESEMVVADDLMEPSLHKYVTVRRGVSADTEEQESSGSNSFAGGQQLNWLSSSWEPNSADSPDCWTSSSRSNARESDLSPLGGFQRTNGLTESVQEQKRELVDYPRNGIGRGRLGAHGRSAYSMPNTST